MNVKEENLKIHAVMATYVHAFEMADADLMRSLHWIDDPNFAEIEDTINEPFGHDKFLAFTDWTKRHRKPRRKMKFYDVKVNMLGPEIAYIIACQEISSSREKKVDISRVTLIFLKKADEWKIIHGHFSSMPK